jgi:uncharacterized membrane protein
MAAYLNEWLALLLRWAHFIAGVAWIGASFYFNWLENHLERRNAKGGIAGDLWAVHGGGFYYLQKYEVSPDRLPRDLHWFKWEAYFTWITGFSLLCVAYYFNAGAYMVDRSVADISPLAAIGAGLASLLASWFFYDGLCRSPLRSRPALLAVLVFAWFVLLAWLLSRYLSGRAAYIHVGAAIGTVMVANVFRVIIPAQKDLVAALEEQREPDAQKGKNALLRSRHNNYLTLPVLFIMISSHYPGTFGHAWNWLVLVVISMAAVGIRHWFNVRHREKPGHWLLAASLLFLAGLIFLMRPQMPPEIESGKAYPTTAEVMPTVRERCVSCHAAAPSYPGFASPPLGLVLEREEELEQAGPRVFQAVVITRTMPLGNISGMTEEERDLLAQWYAGRLRR